VEPKPAMLTDVSKWFTLRSEWDWLLRSEWDWLPRSEWDKLQNLSDIHTKISLRLTPEIFEFDSQVRVRLTRINQKSYYPSLCFMFSPFPWHIIFSSGIICMIWYVFVNYRSDKIEFMRLRNYVQLQCIY
jgi:hypothetical protein